MPIHWSFISMFYCILRKKSLTFVCNKVVDIATPTKHNVQHLLSQIIIGGIHVIPNRGGAIRHITQSSPSEWEQI